MIFHKTKKSLILTYILIVLLIRILCFRKKLIIVCDQYGRLGNRLHLFAQLIKFANKNNLAVWMPSFYDYWHFFPNLDQRPTYNCTFYPFTNFISAENIFFTFNFIFKRVNKFKSNRFFCSLSFHYISNGNPWQIIKESNSLITFFGGFVFHEFMLNCDSILTDIKDIFRPAYKYDYDIHKPIMNLRSRNDLVCGVLVRQTDYRSWNDGKYFYTSKQYSIFLDNLKCSFKNRKIGFFIATDEAQDEKLYGDLDCIIRVGYPLENLYTLSLCDFLIGPPSSYIGWSAFISNKTLRTLLPNSQPLLAKDFGYS